MSDTRPDDDGAMFFVGMKFAPNAELSQKALNRIVIQLFRRIFITPEGEPFTVKEHENTMLQLVQFLVDLDMRLDEEAFAEMPDDLKKYFNVIHRDGTEYRYGSKPRWV